jgi:hypothetical protein
VSNLVGGINDKSYPSSARVSLVRLKVMGASTRLTRPKATDITSGASSVIFIGEDPTILPSFTIVPADLSVVALVIAFFQKDASHHGS